MPSSARASISHERREPRAGRLSGARRLEVTAVPPAIRFAWERGGRSAKSEGETAVKATVPLAPATKYEAVLPDGVQEAL